MQLRPIVRVLAVVVSYILILLPVDSYAKTHRSYAVKAEFKRLNPCPANGNRRGPCPNYQVDHVTPLCAGGLDAVENLQWLTVEEHKAKTKREAGMCRR